MAWSPWPNLGTPHSTGRLCFNRGCLFEWFVFLAAHNGNGAYGLVDFAYVVGLRDFCAFLVVVFISSFPSCTFLFSRSSGSTLVFTLVVLRLAGRFFTRRTCPARSNRSGRVVAGCAGVASRAFKCGPLGGFRASWFGPSHGLVRPGVWCCIQPFVVSHCLPSMTGALAVSVGWLQVGLRLGWIPRETRVPTLLSSSRGWYVNPHGLPCRGLRVMSC